jgi:hypothetical protein
MHVSRTRKLTASLFSLIVLGSAIFYWSIWEAHVDYFIVAGEANLRPIAAAEAAVWPVGSRVIDLPQAAGLDEVTRDVAPLLQGLSDLPKREAMLTRRAAEVSAARDAAWKKASQNASKEIEKYEREGTATLATERNDAEARLKEAEKTAENLRDPVAALPVQISAANLRVQLAQIDVRLAQKRLEIADFVSEQYGAFITPADRATLKRLSDEEGRLLDEQLTLQTQRTTLRDHLSKILARAAANRRSRLSFVDFVYFSLGVSTTVTFGDITPNHTLVRTAVSVQLLLSIVVVGVFLNSLASPSFERPPNSTREPDVA